MNRSLKLSGYWPRLRYLGSYLKRPRYRLLLLSLFSLAPAFAFALGFGEVKLHSYIDEPMDAEIELLGAENYEPERILVSLASAQEFKRAALARPFLLSQLHFQVLRTAVSTVIRVTSYEPIHQPYLEFLIDLSWPGGRLVRGYTLLLDPAPAGTPPLHERRPMVMLPPIKENRVNLQPEPVTKAKILGAPNNFTQQNILSQQILAQQNVGMEKVKSHQQRFEKLFDDKNGEINPHPEAAPMTIVSASEGVNFASPDGSRPEPYNRIENSMGVAVNPGTSSVPALNATREPSPVLIQPAEARLSSPVSSHHNQPIQNNVADPLGKIQWILVAVLASILLLCGTLIVIFARRHKQPTEKVQAIKMETPTTTEAVSLQVPPTQLARGVEITHAALYGGTLSYPPVATSPSESYPERSPEEIKIHPTIPNEMTMKLELAKNYFQIGDDESALALLEDVASRGTEWEKQTAKRLLTEHAAESIT